MTTQLDTDEVRRRAYQALAPILGAVALNRTQPDYALGPVFDVVHQAILAEETETATAPQQTPTDEEFRSVNGRIAFARAKTSKWQDRLDKAQAELGELQARNRHKLDGMLGPVVDAVQTLTEEPPPAPTLDSDPRTPADQAHEFFTRPGDFYQVALSLPVSTNGADIGAQFMVKADDNQLPYLLEVLRQLRGALGAHTHVELTKAQITPRDDPSMEIGQDFTLGDRFPASPGVPIPRIDGVQLGTGALTPPVERELQMADLVDQVDQIAEQHGVKPEQVQVIPVRGGGYAYTVKPEPQPEHGRHARPDDWESSPKPQHLAADDDHDDDQDQP